MASQAELELLIQIREQGAAVLKAVAEQTAAIAPAAQQATNGLATAEGAIRKTGTGATAAATEIKALRSELAALRAPQQIEQLHQQIAHVGSGSGEATRDMERFGQSLTAVARFAERPTVALGRLTSMLTTGLGFGAGAEAATILGGVAAEIPRVIAESNALGEATRSLQLQTGATAQQASGLLAVFERYGVEADKAGAQLGIFARHLHGIADESDAALASGKGFNQTMADLNIRLRDSAGQVRPMVDVLLDLADQFHAMPDGIDKTGLATTAFGRAGRELIPILNLGAAGMKEAMAAAEAYGVVLTQDNVEAIHAATMANKDLKEALGGLGVSLALIFDPLETEAAKHVAAAIATARHQTALENFRDLILSLPPIVLGQLGGQAGVNAGAGATGGGLTALPPGVPLPPIGAPLPPGPSTGVPVPRMASEEQAAIDAETQALEEQRRKFEEVEAAKQRFFGDTSINKGLLTEALHAQAEALSGQNQAASIAAVKVADYVTQMRLAEAPTVGTAAAAKIIAQNTGEVVKVTDDAAQKAKLFDAAFKSADENIVKARDAMFELTQEQKNLVQEAQRAGDVFSRHANLADQMQPQTFGDPNLTLDRQRTILDRQIADQRKAQDRAISEEETAVTAGIQRQSEAVSRGYDAQITAIERKRDADLKAIDDSISAEHRRHDSAMADLDAEERAVLGQLNDQLKAIDASEQARDRQRQQQELQQSLATAVAGGDPKAIAAAQQAIADEVHRTQIEDQRAAIRDQMDAERQSIADRKTAEQQATTDALDALNAQKAGIRDAAQFDIDALKVRRQAALDMYKDRVEAVKVAYDYEKIRIEDIRQAEDRRRADQVAGVTPTDQVPAQLDVNKAYQDAIDKLTAMRKAADAQVPALDAVKTAAQGATGALVSGEHAAGAAIDSTTAAVRVQAAALDEVAQKQLAYEKAVKAYLTPGSPGGAYQGGGTQVPGFPIGTTGTPVPSFAYGGIVPGPLGRPMLAMVHGGEHVSSAGAMGGGDTHITVNVTGNTVQSDAALAELVASKVEANMGNRWHRSKGGGSRSVNFVSRP